MGQRKWRERGVLRQSDLRLAAAIDDIQRNFYRNVSMSLHISRLCSPAANDNTGAGEVRGCVMGWVMDGPWQKW